ncbi:tRNA (guanosine(37)-N1)-methyltransferase TrmD [Candidatus Roizmanbacteria bacterium RIFCSPHIGHO2_02_FULL_37_15]|uniref:tRNA (guanine-N(1)-)-methyltransferase n=1 Tax=Candidatus Roizmanbacteria bacterium RIFCSPLOWO2_01_FULL_37_16 TaxID=1802058 RepID=A0A1F7INM8_9BACT|nr:MAG: tRNA (guanosine(37)-N1)-methyltransferase TrmD [Candidatus Roizmanbacteria bacterium RIFCSPHIGHO2_01_FULL_37_16b]OGK21430.1 MAG: tRNA (guanosine(37)-N1)-methyltransferase TrmD [Candidatus Roizmanbacteria bacterium RIFCSPHIGHO2_02_FULL_37_15]OGK32414.1 MAG: tRNA (guanosine(37)-N1)-methyltransferase TrmD [Candidatus Roizmanbacteria bacterium RIFCSPHIGHO2_12_FULL_36_11]OGK44959.1 MAG: tRNA (guanosine(37)-N1)-methyltransferase TrmD [Candidatus Roizmanbacteria bacterium RIFCSPLOWO2_01_FULL_37
MKISVLTLFPKMISGFFEESIVKRAQEKKLVQIELVNLRDFAIDDYRSVDDRPYGGGAGMIMRIDVIYKALVSVIPNLLVPRSPKDEVGFRDLSSKKQMLKRVQHDKVKTILTSPKGKVFDQQLAVNYSKLNHLIIISGHYEGVDERVRDFVDEEVSLGDFVMTGGEITASAIVDSVVRLLPGALKKEEATVLESLMSISIKHLIEIIGGNKLVNKLSEKGVKEVKLLEYPQYTRPENFKGKKVPEVLLSGNHKEIEKWRLKKAFEETLKKRPDLLS